AAVLGFQWAPPVPFATSVTRSGAVSRRGGGIFDYAGARNRLAEGDRMLEDPDVWSDPERAQNLGRERARLDELISKLDNTSGGLDDASELVELAVAEEDGAA